MARLPNGWLVSEVGEDICLIKNPGWDEEVVVLRVPAEANAIAQAQKTIYDMEDLEPESKCFAHFWFGYFFAHMHYGLLADAQFNVTIEKYESSGPCGALMPKGDPGDCQNPRCSKCTTCGACECYCVCIGEKLAKKSFYQH